MNAIRSISIQAPTIEALELLVEEAGIADLALASTPRLDGVVGDWGAYRSVEVAAETTTFHTLDGFAAMVFGLVLQPASGMPTLATVTVTASTIDDTPRIISVDHSTNRVMIEDGDAIESHGAERFVGTFAASFHETSFARTSPIAHAHLAGFGLGWEGMSAVTVTGEAGAVAASFKRLPGRGDETDRYVFDAEVEATFATDEAGIDVTTVFDARVIACVDGDDLLICAIEFLPARGSGLPGSRNAPLGSPANPVVVEEIVEHDPAETAVVLFVLGLGMLDVAHLSSPMLDIAIGGFSRRDSAWNGIDAASLSPIRGTLAETPDHVEIDAVLTVTGRHGANSTHDVVVRMRRCGDDLHFAGLALRSVARATGILAAADGAAAIVDPRGETLIEAVERLDRTCIWPYSTAEVDNAIGHWSEVETACIVADRRTLTLDDDHVAVTGALKAVTVHGDRIERPVLVTVNEPSDQHASPEIDLLP